MLDESPIGDRTDRTLWIRAIDATAACAETCTACAAACLGEEDVARMVPCVRLDLDCADLCIATGRLLVRPPATGADAYAAMALGACARACGACADECEIHGRAGMRHYAVCAEACRGCAHACEDLLAVLGGSRTTIPTKGRRPGG